MIRTLKLVPIAAGVLAGVCLLAQAPPAPPSAQQPIFKSGVEIVRVDVTVVDKNHHAVRGLTSADFTILEDGKPQPIATFAPVDIPDPPATPVVNGRPVTWMRDVAPDVQSNSLASGRLIVLLIDDALLPNDPRIVANAKKVTHQIVDRLGPGDRMSVLFTEGARQAQDFTGDHEKLQVAVDKMHTGRAVWTLGWEAIQSRDVQMQLDRNHNPHPGPDPDAAVRDASFATLQMVSDALLSSPERRKVLIYVSPGVPANAGMAGQSLESGGTGGVKSMMNREAHIRLAEQMPELFRRMQRANIMVYAIDPAGPQGIAEYAEGRIAAIPQMHEYNQRPVDPSTQEALVIPCDNRVPVGQVSGTDSGPPGVPPGLMTCSVPEPGELARFVTTLGRDFLVEAAEHTGGRAMIGNEDYAPFISEDFEENSSYYLLGYQPPAGDKPGNLHRLTVRVNRPGLEARTRSGYYTPKADVVDPKKSAISPSAKAVAGVLPTSDVPLRVALAPVLMPGKHEATVLITLGLETPAQTKPFSDVVEVQTHAFRPDGDPRGSQVQQAYVGVRPSLSDDLVRYEALTSIVLKPGRYQLRIGAYSGLRDTAGSVYADVEVPDFAKEPIALSGLMLTSTPALPAAPADLRSE